MGKTITVKEQTIIESLGFSTNQNAVIQKICKDLHLSFESFQKDAITYYVNTLLINPEMYRADTDGMRKLFQT